MSSLAVVGGGPRALWALERLAAWALRSQCELPAIDVYSSRGRVGASEHYDPEQPSYLRLNVAAAAIDADPTEATAGRTLPSFDQWRSGGDPAADLDPYPSRALAGAYLDAMADRVLAAYGDGLRVRRAWVDRLRRPASGGQGWTVETATDRTTYDQVLLVTGHAHIWSGRLQGAIPAYPIDSMTEAVPDGGRVIVRGAALSAIDVVLALTEGRGGRFALGDAGGGYAASGREPSITLVSRSGLLMLPKTAPAVLARLGATPERAQLLAAQHLCVGDWAGALVAVAGALVPDVRWSRVRSLGPSVLEGDGDDPRTLLRADLAIARGDAAPDARWALGQAWRLLYATLVDAQERDRAVHSDGPTLRWPSYAGWAAGAERLAFGPPPVNASKLLALLDAGIVEVVAGNAAQTAEDQDADVLVDAVLAPPGLGGSGVSLWPDLLATGAVSLGRHGRGIRVDAAGGCVGSDGHSTPGLWSLGRVAEDDVIGHDTLIRSLHVGPELWARRILGLDQASPAPLVAQHG